MSRSKISRRADLDVKLDAPLDTLVNETYHKSEICRDFNRGNCTRGRSCPFRHQRAPSPPETCRDYLRGSCLRGSECPYYHSKSHYVFTTDRHVDLSRSPSTHSNHISDRRPEPLPSYTLVPQICKDNLRGECKRGSTCPFTHRSDYVEVCRDFIRGKCDRGSQCPFHHMVNFVNSHKTDAEICRDFQRGECKRYLCPYLHVPECVEICKNFLENRCRSGSRCPFHHVMPSENGHDHKKKRQRTNFEEDEDEFEKSPTQLNRELLDQIRLLKEENQVLKEENILIRTESNRLREKLANHGLDSYGL